MAVPAKRKRRRNQSFDKKVKNYKKILLGSVNPSITSRK